MTDRKFGIAINTSFDGKGFDDAKKAAAETEQHARKSARAMAADYEEAFGRIGKAAAVGFAALTTAVGFSVKAFAAQDDAVNKVRAAVLTAGASWDELGAQTQSAASAIQSYSRYGDEELLPVLARMISMTGDAAGATENLGLVADVAAALQIDLAASGDAVARAMQGEAGRLGMLLPGLAKQLELLGENATAAERSAVILRRLGEFQGRAAEDALTLSGSLKQAKDAVGDAAENFGAIFAPAVRDAAVAIKEGAISAGAWIREHDALIKTLTTIVVPALGAATAIYAVEKAFLAAKIAFAAFNTAVGKSPWGIVIRAGIVLATPAILYLIEKLSETKDATDGLWESTDGCAGSYGAAQKQTKSLSDELDDLIKKMRAARDETAALQQAATDIKPSAFVPPASVDSGQLLAELDATHNAIAAEQLAAQTRLNEAALALETDKAAAILAEDQALRAQRTEIWQQTFDGFMAATQSVQAAYQTAVGSMVDMEMTGKERREAIWDSFKQTAVRQIADVTRQHIFGALARSSADRAAGAVAQSESMKAASLEIANSARVIAAKIQEIAAKIYGFYASLGPFGIPAAAATMAGIIAAIRALKFQAGGLVPGSGFGDRVPALLEPGEFVIRRPVAQRNLPALQALNAGQTVSAGTTINVTVNAAKQLSYGDMLDIRRMVEEMLPRALENLTDRRALRSGWPRA